MVFDSTGDVYVADYVNNHIQVYIAEGDRVIDTWWALHSWRRILVALIHPIDPNNHKNSTYELQK